MPAYCIFDIREVMDREAAERYRAAVLPVVEAAGGRYVAMGGPARIVEDGEGAWHPSFPVIIEFPDLAAAERWYASEAYRPLLEQRRAATRSTAVFVAGLPG